MASAELIIGNASVRMNSDGYLSLTDLSKARGGYDHLKNWLRNANTIAFIEAWEEKHGNSNWVEFDLIKDGIGLNTYRMSAEKLIEYGVSCLSVSRGRYGGTYAAVQVALHFANWLDARFYLEVLDEYLGFIKEEYGEDTGRWRFARELAAENYDLIKESNLKALPNEIDVTGIRKSQAKEGDIINLAAFGQTAQQWRADNPDKHRKGLNMRDCATPEDLKVVAQLQLLNSRYIEHGADYESRLELLLVEAKRLQAFYYGKHAERQFKKYKDDW